jgi:S-adenosylmethionine decarboxylase
VSSIGSHFIVDMYECPAEVLDDPQRVQQALRDAVRAAKATLLHETAHRFEPQGVTAVGLLAESHISVHTWPELGYAAADLFTCGDQAAPEAACRLLVQRLEAERFEIRRIPRGVENPQVRPARLPESGSVTALRRR